MHAHTCNSLCVFKYEELTIFFTLHINKCTTKCNEQNFLIFMLNVLGQDVKPYARNAACNITNFLDFLSCPATHYGDTLGGKGGIAPTHSSPRYYVCVNSQHQAPGALQSPKKQHQHLDRMGRPQS